ncbi:MAG: M23 family metallopeptidase [Firmicutes bacterium]|nr:M23 family metallopeptidase [Bacillota bacterium]
MGIGYRWHSLRRRLRTFGSESLLLRQSLLAGILYLAVWGLVQINIPITSKVAHYIQWSVAEYKPSLSWEQIQSWGEESLNLPALSVLQSKGQDSAGVSLAGYTFPVEEGQVISRYGWRLHPVSGEKRFHQGIDIAAPAGTPIKTIASGFVSQIREEELLGKVVEISHGNGITSLYGHLDRVLVEPKQVLKQGDIIATVGSTGVSSGNHLHLEIKERGVNVDPAIKLGVVEQAVAPAQAPCSDQVLDKDARSVPAEDTVDETAEVGPS